MNKVEIFGVGTFDVLKDLTHRSRCYIKTNDNGLYKEIQFDHYDQYETDYQRGYDLKGNEIKIKCFFNDK